MSDEKEPELGSDPVSDALSSELIRIIEFHIREYDMTYANLIGTLELVKAMFTAEWLEREAEIDGDEDDEGDESPGLV